MPAWIILGVTIVAGGVFVLMVLETHLLARGERPITPYARGVIYQWPGPAFGVAGLLVFAVGLLFAHFVWDAPLG